MILYRVICRLGLWEKVNYVIQLIIQSFNVFCKNWTEVKKMDWIQVDQNKDKKLSPKESMSALLPSQVAPTAMDIGLRSSEKETLK